MRNSSINNKEAATSEKVRFKATTTFMDGRDRWEKDDVRQLDYAKAKRFESAGWGNITDKFVKAPAPVLGSAVAQELEVQDTNIKMTGGFNA